MLSRWTNFLTEDGEKEWRKRDEECEDTYSSKEQLIAAWSNGWNCLFSALQQIKEEDLVCIVYIRNHSPLCMVCSAAKTSTKAELKKLK